MNRKIEEIDPERFIYQNYEPDYWTRLGMCFSCGCLDVAKKAKACAIGWCDASRLSVRPRPGCIAVMCEDEDGEPFWFRMECGLMGIEPLSSDDFRHNRFSLTVRKRKPTAPSKDYNRLLCWAKHMQQLIENRG